MTRHSGSVTVFIIGAASLEALCCTVSVVIQRPLATVKDLVPTSPKHQIPPGDAAVGVGVGAAGAGVGAAVGVGSSHLKFTMCGLLSGTPATPYSIRMCPPLTTKNWNQYKPLLAVGMWHGVYQPLNNTVCVA